ncbi:PhzF family phenazine biosynthesis protein [Kitasatospora sp. NPDC018619]|uniref:PhzF family phenazine biosynthesis protein n=1 Tax=unclassified Kitasatospora TaxID=2633591 RepID=UPI00378CF349
MKMYQVDAFSEEPFTGNPAAVCLLDDERDEAWMQAVAAEMNLAETAFLRTEPDGGRRLRWFTPTVEVDLCGHATLAAAHILWQRGSTEQVLRFRTRSGELLARRTAHGIELDFPAEPAEPLDEESVAGDFPGLAKALGTEPVRVGRNRFDLLVELADAHTVRSLAPDLLALRAYPVRGVIVTAAADSAGREGDDFVSRFFAPRYGVDEDPVTGSAHCCLGPYWGGRLGRDVVTGHQASARGGRVRVRTEGDRVFLSGAAVTVLRGELL